MKKKSNNVVEMSLQRIEDCSDHGNEGCNGQNFVLNIHYISGRGNKLANCASYSHIRWKKICRSRISEINLDNSQYESVSEGDEKILPEALINYRSLFIDLDADSRLLVL